MTTPNCTHCNDTGRLPGSDYFDCAHCDVAKERTELGEFAEKAGVYELAHVYDDALFAVHRRATAIGRASALAELHPNWLAEKERADRAEARIAELEAQIAAASAPADTNKLREKFEHVATVEFSHHKTKAWILSEDIGYTLRDGQKLFVFRGTDAELAASTALQAPVREVPDSNVEKLGETCIDGGKCHHECKDKCFRRDCCSPLSDYTGPWAYPALPAAPVQEPKP